AQPGRPATVLGRALLRWSRHRPAAQPRPPDRLLLLRQRCRLGRLDAPGRKMEDTAVLACAHAAHSRLERVYGLESAGDGRGSAGGRVPAVEALMRVSALLARRPRDGTCAGARRAGAYPLRLRHLAG